MSDPISVQANTQYDLYAWVRGELDGEDSASRWYVRLRFYDASGNYLTYANAASGGPGTIDNSWQLKGGQLTIPSGTATVRIQLLNHLNSGWTAFDDVELKKVGTGTNLVSNPGFEGGNGWSEVTSSQFPGTSMRRTWWGTSSPHSGTYAYAISNHAYGFLRSPFISVQPNTEYDLYAWVRGELDADDSAGWWLLRVRSYDANGNDLGYQNVAQGQGDTLSTGWQQKGGRFTTPANAATVRIQLFNYLNSGWVAYDDVRLTLPPPPTPTPTNTPQPTPTPTAGPPPAPTNLTAQENDLKGWIVLSWNPFSPPSGTMFNVYRNSTSPVPRDTAHRIGSGVTSGGYVDINGQVGDYYVVTAVNSYGESGPSNTAQAQSGCTFNCPQSVEGASSLTAGVDTQLAAEGTLQTTGVTQLAAAGTLQTTVITYDYDPLYRLTDAGYTGAITGTYSYTYDAVGNRAAYTRTITSTQVTTYTYNAANQLETAKLNTSSDTWYYEYDGNGNQIRQVPNGLTPAAGEVRYTFDQRNQLVSIENHDGSAYETQAEMIYDGSGHQRQAIAYVAGVAMTTTFTIDRQNNGAPLLVSNSTGDVHLLYGLFGLGEKGAAWQYYLGDSQFSVRQVVEVGGSLALARTFDPFGSTLQQSGDGSSFYGFAGSQSGGAGLLYINGRYFDPSTGRFLSPDRDSFDPKRPGTLNGYLLALFLANPGGLLFPPLILLNWRKRKRRRGVTKADLFLLGLLLMVSLSACATPNTQPATTTPTAGEISQGTPPPPPQEPSLPSTNTPISTLPSVTTEVLATCTPSPPVLTPTPTGSYLLDISVQILFYSSTTGVANRGIGTVVDAARRVVVTHNHYILRPTSDKVRILDAKGNHLNDFDKSQVNLVDYSDGTLLLGFPADGLVFSQAARLGDYRSVQNGDPYKQVIKEKPVDPDKPALTVLNTEVENSDYGALSELNRGIGHFLIADPGMVVDVGDSGGGGFVNNELVANTWSALHIERRVDDAPAEIRRAPSSVASKHPWPTILQSFIEKAAYNR